jgi:glycerol uptake facilitator protein
MTAFTADLSPTHSTFTRLRAGIAGAMLAEFFGTFVLLLLGLGTCAVNTVGLPGSGRQTVPFGPDNWLINVFGWAFAVMLAAYVSGGISGAHFNPAVTLAFAVARKFDWRNVIPYWVAQIAGAVAGILLYDFFIGHVLDARAAMLRTPEPGLAPVPTTGAAAGVAGPVTAEDSADAEEFDQDRAA